MGLQSTIQNAAKAAMAAVGDLASDLRFLSYDRTAAGADALTSKPVYVEYIAKRCVKSDYRTNEVDGVNILPTDQKLLIAYLNIGTTPQEDDVVIIDDWEWEVKGVGTDPAQALWVVQIRKRT